MSVDVLKALAQCAEDGVRQDRLLLELSTAIISKFETLQQSHYALQTGYRQLSDRIHEMELHVEKLTNDLHIRRF